MDLPESHKSMDLKSVKTFRSKDEYLYAMKEDLAEWLCELHQVSIDVDNFFDVLDTGTLLCKHANTMIAHMNLPETLPFRNNAQVASFQARDNLSLFISFCRKQLKIPDTLLFESEDLVSRKNERSVVLCLLEVGRRGARFGVVAPQLVQLEQEIDEEIETEKHSKKDVSNFKGNKMAVQCKSTPKKKWVEVDMMTLDEMVRLILSRCSCQQQYPMIRLSEGKYTYGGNLTPIFLRVLRSHVMVRTGGGWDTLESFLGRHDPCRCNSKEHRGALAFKNAFKKKPQDEVEGFKKTNDNSCDSDWKSIRTETPIKKLNENLNTGGNTLYLLNNVQNLIAHTNPKNEKVERPTTANNNNRSTRQTFKRPLNQNNTILNQSSRSQNVNPQLSRYSKSLHSSNESIKGLLDSSRRQSIQVTNRSIPQSKSFISQKVNTTSIETSDKNNSNYFKTPIRPASARPRNSESKRNVRPSSEANNRRISQSAEKLNDDPATTKSLVKQKTKNYNRTKLNLQNNYSKSLNASKESINSESNSSRRYSMQAKNRILPQSKSFVTPRVNMDVSSSVQKIKSNSKFKTPLRPMSARPRESENKRNVKAVNNVISSQRKLSFSVENISEIKDTGSKSEVNKLKPTLKARKDLLSDLRTKIPAPMNTRKRLSNESLKRADSGVDITGALDDSETKNCIFAGKDFY